MYRPYPFAVKFLSIPSTYSESYNTFDPSTHGITCLNNLMDTRATISCIAYYLDGKVEIYSKTITILGGSTNITISPSMLDDAFIYNSKHSGLASYVEFIVYPISCSPLKWSFNFS